MTTAISISLDLKSAERTCDNVVIATYKCVVLNKDARDIQNAQSVLTSTVSG